MRPGRGVAAALLIGLSAAIAAQSTQGVPAAQNTQAAQPAQEYRIGKGDVLQVSVWGEPQLSQHVTVRPDGKISLPLLSDFLIDNLSVREAEHVLTTDYATYLKHPEVSVLVAEVHSKFVYVTGEVQRPGAYPMLAPITVVQLIARAGGVTPFAKSKQVYVLHATAGPRVRINYKALLQGDNQQNLALVSGDTVVIP